MHSLTERIKQQALQLGFDKVGVAPAVFLDEESTHLEQWLFRGYHGTMEWMARNFEKRVDPRVILSGAKSVIAVAMNYYADVRHSDDAATGKISRYAWGDDYHEIVTDRLDKLLEIIKAMEPTAEGKVYVDTGPVMDKAWAQRAGIGWEGKHTNVITQEYGSWVFLGEIILNLELEYDSPATDHCGTCTLCIEACPTEAITEPYVLDSNLCISYLTIEHRGEIAEKVGEKFDRWIYGCDICQDVCPWNHKFSTPTQVQEFQPRESNVAPNLLEITKMSQEDFSEAFRKSPIKRTKHAGLQRNVQAVISNQSKIIQK
ncbi:MAG: tRNA epoxyqueuosine(34) reductase QueG [Ignavibacteria bacterium]|nr:tRNA epoxyqueuosine(34) reductase QueG [Ignavibacteria bacterium]